MIWIPAEMVRVGDRLLRHSVYGGLDELRGPDGHPPGIVLKILFGKSYSRYDEATGTFYISCTGSDYDGLQWLVDRPITSSEYTQDITNPVKTTAWNGRCPKCGKGTYTGFLSMEHEGGNCV